MSRIAILGSGAWGTALALSLARKDTHQLTLWCRQPATAARLAAQRENTAYLPGFPIPASIHITADAAAALAHAEIVLSVIPSAHLRTACAALAPYITPAQLIVSATKGLEEHTHLRISQLLASVFAQSSPPLAVLSGPSFAHEVARALPAALTVASANAAVAERIQQDFGSPTLRLYTNEDVVGVELGGALKNVIAIATGVAAGLELGHNTTAALITRGVAEITRLAIACGGRRDTLSGLSGLGDLVLTCTGALSRNRSVGIELGRGRPLAAILHTLGGQVAEGVRTTSAALSLAHQHRIEMPITEEMNAILHHGKDPHQAMRTLMSRPGREE